MDAGANVVVVVVLVIGGVGNDDIEGCVVLAVAVLMVIAGETRLL